MAIVKVTSVAPVDAPNRAQPSSSRTIVGRIVHDRAVLEGREGHQRDDAHDDRQVRPGEQPTGPSGALAAAAAVGAAVPEVVMIPS